MNDDRVIVVGAGLGGTLMAAILARAGYAVDIYERRSDPRGRQVDAGRSINLAISTRGLEALREVGLEQAILSVAVPMYGRMIHSPTGHLAFQKYGVEAHQAINSVSRLGLNISLLNTAEACPGVRVIFDHRCVGVDLPSGKVSFRDEKADRIVQVNARFVIGGDGAFSAVRADMQRTDRFEYSQSYLSHGYKELHIPAGPSGSHLIEKNGLHIWPRKRFMMIALPNQDGSFTCTLFWPFEGEVSFASVQTEAQVRSCFETHFSDAVPLMPTLVHDFLHNPTSSLVTVKCGPWFAGDKVVLLGDAAHAVVPFYGQGANASFEDCVVLAECLKSSGKDLGRAFETYYDRRKRHTDALADLAIENFLEMRDKTGSRAFLLRKKGEKLMHRLLPNWYLPLYSMVTFSRIPYGDAVERAQAQNRTILRAAAIVLIALALTMILLARSG